MRCPLSENVNMNTIVEETEKVILDAIAASGKGNKTIATAAGVFPRSVQRFVRRQGGLSLRSAAKLMALLGLEIRKRE
jgi:hypothetical protein